MSFAEQPLPDELVQVTPAQNIENLSAAIDRVAGIRRELSDISLTNFLNGKARALRAADSLAQVIRNNEQVFIDDSPQTTGSINNVVPIETARGPEPHNPQPSEDLEEDAPERVVSLVIDGQLVTSQMLGLNHDNDLAFLESLPDFEMGERFAAKDILAKEFHPDGTPAARKQAFLISRAKVMDALEHFMGRPIIGHEGIKAGSRYWLITNVRQASPSEVNTPSHSQFHTTERHQKENQVLTEGAELRDAVKPYVIALVNARKAPPKPGERRAHATHTDNTSSALEMHWGLSAIKGAAESQDIEAIARALDLTPYSAKTLIREALKEIALQHKSDEVATNRVNNYLDIVDDL